MELLLVRHALPLRVEGANGAADPELSTDGHAQAEHLATYLRGERIDALYASPLRRAKQTAAPVAAAFGLDVGIVDGVAEYDRHSDTYIPAEEMKASNHPMWQAIVNGEDIEGHEPRAEFHARVLATVEQLVVDNPGRRIAVVCHGGVINSYLSHVLGLAVTTGFFYPNYTSINRVVAARSGERSISTVNETSHLRGTGLRMGMH